MTSTPLNDLLTTNLASLWEPLPDGDGWRRAADLDTGGDSPLPVVLGLVPLGPSLDAPLVFTATLPTAVAPPGRASALVSMFSARHVGVGTVEVSGGHVRYRLSHDPAVAPHSESTVQGLIEAGTGWATRALSDALFALMAAGVSLAGDADRSRSDKFAYTSPDQIRTD